MQAKTTIVVAGLLLLVIGCQLGPRPEPLAPVDEEALALIESGADLNAPLDETGATVLHRVAADGTPPVAQKLLDAGADPNLPAALPLAPRLDRRAATMATASTGCTGYYAPTNGRPVVYGGVSHCFREGVGSTLHHAVRSNSDTTMIATLIDGGADPNGRGYEATPLHVSLHRGADAPKFISALIANGADPNRTTYHVDHWPDGRPDRYTLGWTSLCAAAGYHLPRRAHLSPASLHTAVIQALIDNGAGLLRSGPQVPWGDGATHNVLNCAAEGIGSATIVRYVVEAGKNAGIVNYVNRVAGIFHPLCGAALGAARGPAGALAVVRELLQIGANPNGYGTDTVASFAPDGPPAVPLVCAQRGRERHASHSDAGLYDTMIEVLIAAGAVWPEED